MMARLTRDEYVDQLHREGERLLAVADGNLERAVPGCPGWTVADLVEHVGMVYAHKAVALEHGRRPEPGEWTGPPWGTDVVDWCHALLHRLAADLSRLEMAAPAWTWWEPDQTAGFWHRRMALETAVHRADAEAAAGPVTPIDNALAVDGIDELLDVMLRDAGVTDTRGPHREGSVVSVSITGTTVAGDPSGVLLWLWGRAPDDAVTVEGDRAGLRALLRGATQ
jgi:uncharacterized protein (TIGR03083 family)